MNAVPLRAANLGRLGGMSIPTYDRGSVTTGIVHFGLGNFHRSHEAMYLDRLMESGQGQEWGICGVGILAQDVRMRDVMNDQDGLYTLILRHADGSLEPRVVGSITEYLFGPDDPEAVYARLVDPAVRIVSLTVTEGGYLRNPATGGFDAAHGWVAHDLEDPSDPQTAFAYIVEGLRRRREAGVAPFTVLSCDNLQGNGTIARQTVVGFARLVSPELGQWIDDNVAFPNGMVDRITPATTDADRESIATRYGIEDGWPVPGEPFTQWIIEDLFPSGRPELEVVGVQFVDDVEPYELMKLRLLNASHQAIAYLGAPLGYVLVDEAMRDERIRSFLMAYMTREAVPTLGALPGVDVDEYIATLIERFSNPYIVDTLVRLATDGSNRMSTFTLPTIRDNLAAGRSVALGAAMVAAWAHYWELIGSGSIPEALVPADAYAEDLSRAAASQQSDPLAFVALTELFGDLAEDPRFRAAFEDARATLVTGGVHEMIDRLVSPA